MISQKTINEATKRLVEAYHPSKIYLFGSYAWGEPHADSDLDVMVIVKEEVLITTPDGRTHRRGFAGQGALWGLGISKDLVVLTEAEFEDRCKNEETLAYAVKHYGKLVYAES